MANAIKYAQLRPFSPGESINNKDGSRSSEITTTWQLPDGSWVNAPSLWMGPKGPVQFDVRDEENILRALRDYESASGKQFKRFKTVNEAEEFAGQKSNTGGVGSPLSGYKQVNALKDILGFAGKAADGLLLGGAIHASKRRNQFSDYLNAGQYDEAEQLALRNGEGAYAQVAQQKGASQRAQDDEERQQLGRIAGYGDSITDPAMRVSYAEDVINLFEFDDDVAEQLRLAAKQERGFGALYQAYIGGGEGQPENFGVSPQFVRGSDGQVRAIQFGSRGNVREQTVNGVPIPLEQRYVALDQGQQRINQGYELADPALKGAQAQATGYGSEIGQSQAVAQSSLPQAEFDASQTLDLIRQAKTHPGLNDAYGASSYIPAIRGTDRANFEALREQMRGGAFLTAFQKLKGGGAITQVEGVKAEQAIARFLDPRQTTKAALAALEEYEAIVRKGYEVSRSKANGGVQQQGAPAQQPSAQGAEPIAVNPQTGERLIFRNGQWEPLQ